MRAMARSPDSTANAKSQIRNSLISPGAEEAKSRVMAAIGQLVIDGKAEWSRTATGEIELHLLSGEVFVLSDISVTRIA